MPKEINSFPITLIAIQEEPPAVTPTKEWLMRIAPPGVDEKESFSYPIEGVGNIIAEQIGTAINRPDRVYRIGISMPAGSSIENDPDPLSPTFGLPTRLIDSYLDGLEYSVHLRGLEYMIKGIEWQNDIAGGGFRYTDGSTFGYGQVLTLSFKPQISDVITIPDAVARFVDASGAFIVSTSTVLGSSARRKLILVQGATSAAPTITLDIAYPEGVLCVIQTTEGLNKQTIIQAPGGQDMYQNGVVSYVILGQCDWMYGVRLGDRWYIQTSNSWQSVGQIVFGGVPGPNRIVANGQTLNIADYPRVDDYLDLLLAQFPGSVITVAAWNAGDKTKWARSATQIIAPDMGGDFIRVLALGNGKDPDRVGIEGSKQGSRQLQSVISHNHENADIPGFNRLLTVDGNGTAIATDPQSAPNEPNITTSLPISPYGGSETRPNNIGLIALICV